MSKRRIVVSALALRAPKVTTKPLAQAQQRLSERFSGKELVTRQHVALQAILNASKGEPSLSTSWVSDSTRHVGDDRHVAATIVDVRGLPSKS